MKKFFAVLALVLMSLSSFTSSIQAKQTTAEPQRKIDLAMTLKFIQGWSARDKWDKFPESPSFAYYNTYSLKALNAGISPELREKIVDALKSCQMKDGGFSAGPGHGTDSNTIFTYYSLATLDLLNALDSIDGQHAAAYVRSLIQKDGSIKAKAADAGATLATTYYGVASLGLLHALDTVDKKSVIAYINTYREDRKGYCLIQGKISMPGATFMAVKSLSLLGGMTPAVRTDVVKYLKRTRYSGLMKNNTYRTLPSMEDMAAVIDTLAELSALNVIDKSSVNKFIESLYIPENGGFGPEPGLGTTPPSTYYAVNCLSKIGKLDALFPLQPLRKRSGAS
jgi:prenyltransferase beta subunit